MLPDADDMPTGFPEAAVGVAVTLDVSRNLAAPVPAIHMVLTGPVLGAPVPEATVYEYRKLLPPEDDVGSPVDLRQRPHVNAITCAEPMQGPP